MEPKSQALLNRGWQVPCLRERQHLAIVDKQLRSRFLIEPPLTHILDDTDDLLRRQIHTSIQVDHLPHGILVVEEPLHDRHEFTMMTGGAEASSLASNHRPARSRTPMVCR